MANQETLARRLWLSQVHCVADVKEDLRRAGSQGQCTVGENIVPILGFIVSLCGTCKGDMIVLYRIIDRYLEMGADPNFARDSTAMPPLHIAAGLGNIENVLRLLEAGACINQREHGDLKCTPLMIAAHRGYRFTVETLLQYQANPFLRDIRGRTAKDMARIQNHTRIVSVLENAERQYTEKMRRLAL